MAQFYEMPAISPTMEMGTLVAWKVAEGAKFSSGTVLAEIGTDKANMEAEIFDDGVLIKHLIGEGDEVPPGWPMAIWGAKADEDISALLAAYAAKGDPKAKAGGAPAPAAPAPAAAAPAPEAPAQPAAAPSAQAAPAPAPAPKAAPPPGPTASLTRTWRGKTLTADVSEPRIGFQWGPLQGRVIATPLAKKLAAEVDLDVAKVKGTGPGGRILARDIEGAAQARDAKAASASPARPDEVVRNSPMRKTIARRLFESHAQIPVFFLTAVYDLDQVMAFREDLKAKSPDVKVSVNDILIKAVAKALRDVPEVNASWSDAAITRHGRVDIGVAVALPDGLITPVVRDADQKGFVAIAGEVRELATRAKAGKLDVSEYTGGTFTISNLGMMAIDEFTAIINPPEAAILAVGATQQVPVVKDGQLAVGWRMKVTMSCDHRVIDGALGARFLAALRRYIESPLLLLL